MLVWALNRQLTPIDKEEVGARVLRDGLRMTISLYDASVGCFIQTLGGVAGVLERGLAHCLDCNLDPQSIVETRLTEDMLPFGFQVEEVAHHSLGAIEGARSGRFAPSPRNPPSAYAVLQQIVADALDGLQKITPAEIDALAENDVICAVRQPITFVAKDFLLTSALPNCYFHATTAYNILRMRGAPLGKRDYLGRLKIKR